MTPFALRLIFPFPILMEVTKLITSEGIYQMLGLQNVLEILFLEMRYQIKLQTALLKFNVRKNIEINAVSMVTKCYVLTYIIQSSIS